MAGSPAAAAVDAVLTTYAAPALPPRAADLQTALVAEQSKQHGCHAPVADADQAQVECGDAPVFNAVGLQMWLLLACQEASGLRDKPGKSPDFYHTCYCLSGLAVAQQCSGRVLGQGANAVRRTDVCVNVLPEKLAYSRQRVAGLPC